MAFQTMPYLFEQWGSTLAVAGVCWFGLLFCWYYFFISWEHLGWDS
jgi:hypothetical protein